MLFITIYNPVKLGVFATNAGRAHAIPTARPGLTRFQTVQAKAYIWLDQKIPILYPHLATTHASPRCIKPVLAHDPPLHTKRTPTWPLAVYSTRPALIGVPIGLPLFDYRPEA
jgi:hypothetical protein